MASKNQKTLRRTREQHKQQPQKYAVDLTLHHIKTETTHNMSSTGIDSAKAMTRSSLLTAYPVILPGHIGSGYDWT